MYFQKKKKKDWEHIIIITIKYHRYSSPKFAGPNHVTIKNNNK